MGQPAAIRRQLNAVVATTAAGDKVTAFERVVQLMELGNYIEPVLRQVGINKSSAYRWFDIAARAVANREADPHYTFTADEKAAIEWRNGVWDAEAKGEARLLALLESECRGGQEVRVTTTKTLPDGSVEVTERVEHTRPNVAAITWRLERRHGERWGRKRIELTGAEGGPVTVSVEQRAMELADSLAQLVSDDEPPSVNGYATTTNGH